jgi:hypothetical protein
MRAQSSLLANASGFMRDRLARMFPFAYGLSTKHDYGRDYGWPEQLTFEHFYRLYCRSGLAAAAVDKTIAKTWQTMPALWESEEPAESAAEEAIRKHFAKRKIWRALMDADRRSMVGEYAGAIILLRDGKPLSEPVDRVAPGIENVAGIIPAWQGQLTVAEWDTDQTSETYGEPLAFQFDEQAVGNAQTSGKSQVRIHRDRVLIWSDDGTLNCRSALEPGYNDVSDAEKIKGAGGEGFWKSARGAPIIEAPQGVTPDDLQRGMKAKSVEEVKEQLNDKVEAFQQGFDNALMIGGFSAKPLTITLPQPKEFWEPCVQSFAASMQIPFKILVGNITGERASTEDAEEWAQTNMSRRENRVLPILNEFVDRLVAWGVLDKREWAIGWESLLEDSPDDRLGRAKTMADINQTLGAEPAFLPDEIREAAGFKPTEEIEGWDEFLADREERARRTAEDGPVEDEPEEIEQ